jgi:hypothetical protein
MIVELLKDPPAQSPPPGGAERRRSRRLPVTLPGSLMPLDPVTHVAVPGAAATDVQVRNVSLHGAGLRCTAPMADDDAYHLDIGPGPLKIHARIRVRSSRQRRDGLWDVGVEFF